MGGAAAKGLEALSSQVPVRRRLWRFLDSLRFRVAVVASLVFALAAAVVLSVTVFALWSATADRVANEARAVADRVALDLVTDGAVGASPWEPSVPMRVVASSRNGDRVIEGRVGIDVVPSDSAAPGEVDLGSGAPPVTAPTTTITAVGEPVRSTGGEEPGEGEGGDGGSSVDELSGLEAVPPPALPESSYDVVVNRPGGSDGFVQVSRPALVDDEMWDVQVSATLSASASTIEVFSTLATRSVPGLVIAFGLLVWLMVGAALRQVEHVRAAAESMSGAGRGQRLPLPSTGDELTQVTATFNGLLDRIDRAWSHQQQFISDASHELRSPITTIRALCELAAAHPERTSSAELAGRVDVEAQRLDLLVADLLELARISEGQSAAATEVDLDELVFTEASRVRPAVSVDTSGVVPLRVLGSERRWAMVVRNLVGNAGRYADSKVSVHLSCIRVDGSAAAVRLEVCDDGPGVPEADRERVFDRFVRLDEGRARDAGGTGLGLAVVSDVVEAMGGTRGVGVCASLGGAEFFVEVPVTLADDGSDDFECFDDD